MASEFFEKLEYQRRIDMQKIAFGASLGVLAMTAFIRFCLEPSSLIEFMPVIPGALPGACIAAGVIEHLENAEIKRQSQP